MRECHVTLLAQALSGTGKPWALDRHDGYDGDMMIMLTPPDSSDADFVVSRSRAGFHLAITAGDEYRTLGVFASLAGLVRCVLAQGLHGRTSGMIA